LLARGWHVVAGQYMPDWPELSTLSDQYPETLHIVALDVASQTSAHAAAETTAARVDHLDVLINNAGITSPTMKWDLRQRQDYTEMHRMFDVNALGPLRAVEAFLPLLDNGKMKRLCFVSSEAGSINRAYRTSWYGYCMSKAALNMGVKILFNHVHPEGYTFRLYHPGWVRSYMGGTKDTKADLEPEEAAGYALSYFLSDRIDEDKLVLRDHLGRDWPF
jgi:NAD(P)-dependent dehydrogenase (short-subunit alcohol dehydrogenase family)